MEDQHPKEPQEPHRIDGLEQNMYSREFKTDVSPRASLSPEIVSAPIDEVWKDEPIKELEKIKTEPKEVASPVFKRIFIVSALFFLLSAGVAVFIFYGGLNIISTSKVDMTFVGPVSIAAGDELGFDIIIHNQNRSQLLNTQLYIDYPDGTKQAMDISQDLLHTKEDVGDIPAHTDTQRTVRAVLFGRERTDKEIKVTLEYSVKNSNGIFKKEKSYKVNISSTPLTMTINHPPEVASGQDVSFTVDIASNSNVPLTNLALKAEYPRGFSFRSSEPEALDSTVWKIETLKPGEKKTITITGKAEGEESDERVFRFNIGIADKLNDKAIATSFLTASESIRVRRPPLAATLIVADTNAANPVVNPGQNLNGRIELANNMTVQLIDLQVDLVLGGDALDVMSPKAEGALYRLPNKTITWEKTSLSQLTMLGPGERISLLFSLSTLPQSVLIGIKNGQITLELNARGTAVGTGQLITSNVIKKAKVQPMLSLLNQLLYSSGPFTNSGPVPSKAESKTTYTVTWALTHTTNEIVNAEVHGFLPGYVKWLNVKSPENSGLTWFPERNEVVWQAGTIPLGTVGEVAKEVSFQVEIQPSFSQINTTPLVIDNIWFKGRDTFTGGTISITPASLTTYLPTDPDYKDQSGRVIP